jgi:outer membrane protein assembly factor BamB
MVAGTIPTHSGIANHFAVDRGTLFVANKGLTKYQISKSKQQFDMRKAGFAADVFVGPVFAFDKYVVHLRRRFKSSMITAALSDAETLEEIWRTDFAAPTLDRPFSVGEKLMAFSEQGDLFELTADSFKNGVADPLTRSTTVKENLQFDQQITMNDGTLVLVGQSCDRVLAIRPDRLGEVRLNPMEPPVNRLAGQPAPFGKYLLIPTPEGRVFRVNPLNGSLMGAPFGPPANPNQTVRWTRPAVFEEENLFVIGNDRGVLYSVAAEGDQALLGKSQIDGDAAFVSPLLRIENAIFVITRGTGGDHLNSYNVFPELKLINSKALAQPYIGPFVATSQSLLMVTADSKLVCWKPNLEVAWELPLASKIAGSPVEEGESLVVALDDGNILRLNKNTGEQIKSSNLGLPIAGSPFEFNGNWYLSDVNGVIHVIEPVQ